MANEGESHSIVNILGVEMTSNAYHKLVEDGVKERLARGEPVPNWTGKSDDKINTPLGWKFGHPTVPPFTPTPEQWREIQDQRLADAKALKEQKK